MTIRIVESNPLDPPRFGSVQYGIKQHITGNLVKVDHILIALEYILDDDSEVRNRVVELKEKLINRMG